MRVRIEHTVILNLRHTISQSPPREERERKRTVKLKSGKQQQQQQKKRERERERNNNIAYLLRRRERSPHHNFCFVLIRVCVNLKTDVDFEKKSPFPLLFGTFPDMNTRLEKYESMRESRVVEGETRVCNILSLNNTYICVQNQSLNNKLAAVSALPPVASKA